MKETYKVFIGDSEIADSKAAHNDCVKTYRETDEETRHEALSELAEKIKTKDGKSMADFALDSLGASTVAKKEHPSSHGSDLREEVLTTLEQDVKARERHYSEGGFIIVLNENGDIVQVHSSPMPAERMSKSREESVRKSMESVPYGPKQNKSSFRTRL